MKTYRTRQNVKVCAMSESSGLWDALKPGVYFVVGFLVLYVILARVML